MQEGSPFIYIICQHRQLAVQLIIPAIRLIITPQELVLREESVTVGGLSSGHLYILLISAQILDPAQ